MKKKIIYIQLPVAILVCFGFTQFKYESKILENTNWKILYINKFINGKDSIWSDFSDVPEFTLNFSKPRIKNTKTIYNLKLTTNIKNSWSKYYCQVKRGEALFLVELNQYKFNLRIEKYCNLNETNLYIPLYTVFSQTGTFNLKNDTLVFTGIINGSEDSRIYLVRK